jgi:hypothetical protein
MRIKKGKEKVRWQEAIIGIAMAAIILASVFAVMTGSVSAYSTGGKYNIIKKDDGARLQSVLIGQDLDFGEDMGTDIVTVYRVKDGVAEWGIMGDHHNHLKVGKAETQWRKDGAFFVNYDKATGAADAQLSISAPIMPLEVKVGTKRVSSIAVGTSLTIDTGGMNLLPEDRVDLVIIGPYGQIKYDAINDQHFTNISVSRLKNYGYDGLKTYGWSKGDYTFQVKSKPANACGLDISSDVKQLKILKGEISIDAEPTSTMELDTVTVTVTGVAGDVIRVVADPCDGANFIDGVDDTPTGGCSFTDTIDPDGIRKYAIEFYDTGTYTLRATVEGGLRGASYDTVDITVLEKAVEFDMPNTAIIGERITIKGTATSGTYVSVYVAYTLYPQLRNLVIEDGEFRKEVKTTDVGMSVPGSVRLKAWIDVDQAAGADTPTRTADGEAALLLQVPMLTSELSTPSVAVKDDFKIEGYAPGSTNVWIMAVPPKGGGGKALTEERKGITIDKASVATTDNSFTKQLTVQKDATSGYYDIYVLCTGMDGEWGITGKDDLEAALDERYNITSLTTGIINTMTQAEIEDVLEDLVTTEGADDLMWKHRLKVETAYVKLDPIATVSIGEPLVVTGKSNRQEGLVIFVTCKGPVELPPDLVRIENGAFWCIFDTTGATTGKYIVEADDCEGHTDTATVEILVPSPHAPEASVSSLLHCDITGDSINDILVYVYTIDPVTDMPTKRSHINAIDGSNGETLWNKSFEDCLAVTLSAGDLNGDNKTDLVINLVCTDLISMEASGKVVGVNGCNGVELWSKSKTGDRNEGVAMVGFPANLTSTNRTDVVVSTITFSRYGSRTNITAINGSDGTELWEKSFTDSQVYGVPVDLTNDGKDEVVIGMPQEIGTPLAMMSTMTPNVIAVNGSNGIEIWSNRYPDVATFSPVDDLTGDGATDLTVRIGCCRVDAVRGYDGTRLWTIEV